MAKDKDTPADDGRQEPAWRRQVDAILETQLNRYPYLVQGRAVLRQLDHEREGWPVLIPLLVAVFYLTYRSERRKLLAAQRDIAD